MTYLLCSVPNTQICHMFYRIVNTSLLQEDVLQRGTANFAPNTFIDCILAFLVNRPNISSVTGEQDGRLLIGVNAAPPPR